MSERDKPPFLGQDPTLHPPTYPLQVPHISLLCTVCDRDVWVSVEFSKDTLT